MMADSPFQNLNLQPDLPNYPVYIQLLRVGSTTVVISSGGASIAPGSGLGTANLYTAAVQQLRNDTQLPRDREPAWALDCNGAGLIPGYYLGRLAGSYQSLPVYEVVESPAVTNFYNSILNVDSSVLNIHDKSTLNIYNSSVFNIFETVVNVDTSIFNFLGINYFYGYSNTFIDFAFGPGPGVTASSVGGVLVGMPTELCSYLFECCTTVTLSLSTNNNLSLPAVGSPDKGVIHYDISGGGTITGIVPQGFTLCNNGDITGATDAAPIVLTVPGWYVQPVVGQVVIVKGVMGNTAANGDFVVQAVTGTTLTLEGSFGTGTFTPSLNSTIQLIGPQKIWLHNTGPESITIEDNGAGSNQWNRILLPPTYGSNVILAADDSIELWWDYCNALCWIAESCTVDIEPSGNSAISVFKFTVSYTNVAFTHTGSSQTFSLLTLPNQCVVRHIYYTNTTWTNSLGGNMGASIQNSNSVVYNNTISLFSASTPANDALVASGSLNQHYENFSGTTGVSLSLSITDAGGQNLGNGTTTNLTSGTMTVWVEYDTLP